MYPYTILIVPQKNQPALSNATFAFAHIVASALVGVVWPNLADELTASMLFFFSPSYQNNVSSTAGLSLTGITVFGDRVCRPNITELLQKSHEFERFFFFSFPNFLTCGSTRIFSRLSLMQRWRPV